MEGCVFCRIVAGELPGRVIWADEHALAFMDVANDVDGHILVAPRRHVGSLLDCDAETLARVTEAVRQVARGLTESCGYDGVNLLNASGESAGQSVPHLHFHLIPRRRGDGVDAWPRLPGASRPIEEVFREIRAGMR